MQEVRSAAPWIAAAAFAAGATWGSAPARADGPGAAETFVVAQPGKGAGHNVVYLVDGRGQRLLVYEHTTGGKLELVHARNWEFDARLQQFPPEKAGKQVPPVSKVKGAVQRGG